MYNNKSTSKYISLKKNKKNKKNKIKTNIETETKTNIETETKTNIETETNIENNIINEILDEKKIDETKDLLLKQNNINIPEVFCIYFMFYFHIMYIFILILHQLFKSILVY